MPPTNNFLPFCPTDTGSNLLSQSDYAIATDRTNGNQPGVASAKLNNKAIRQSTYVVGQLAQFLANKTGADVLDDGVSARILAQLTNVLTAYPPVFTKYLSGSGNHNLTYIFAIATGAATVGATYTNNGVTFTVVETVAASLIVRMSGNGAPAVSGTLTKSGGTGDSTLTFYAVRAPISIEVEMVGAGGGGAGAGLTTTATSGGAGGNTTFGTSLLVANGGSGGVRNNSDLGGAGGAGGTASLGTGPVGWAYAGSVGQAGYGPDASGRSQGGEGAGTRFSGSTGANSGNSAGNAGIANSGAGGSGGGAGSGSPNTAGGGGGGAGAYVLALINAPLSTYAYSIPAGGTAGVGGSAGLGGAVGGSGGVGIWERYQ